MTKKKKTQSDRRKRLDIAASNFNRMAESLNALIERVQSGDIVAPGDVNSAVSGLSKALTLVLSEGAKLDDVLSQEDGGTSQEWLDLDAARTEIECRLACLRAARAG